MRCPHCNTENNNDAIFCAECHGWILGSMYTTAPAAQLPEETDQDPPPNRRRWLIFTATTLLCLAVVLTVWLYPRPTAETPCFISLERTTAVSIRNDLLHLVCDGQVYLLDSDSYTAANFNFTGTAGAILDSDSRLHLVLSDSYRTIANNVSHFHFSANSQCLVFYQKDKQQLFYVGEDQLPTAFASDLNLTSDSYAISPNGQYVIYLDDGVLMRFDGQNSEKITAKAITHVLSISNDGNCIFAISPAGQLLSFNARGKRTTLGYPSSEADQDSPLFQLNSDHSQLLYRTADGQTYLSVNGRKPTAFCDGQITPILPANHISHVDRVITHPATTLQGLLYACTRSSDSFDLADLLILGGTAATIVRNARDYWLSPDSTRLYYITEHMDLAWTPADGTGEATVIAENVTRFAVCNDLSLVYYVCDGWVYSCSTQDGSNLRQLNYRTVYDLLLTSDNVLYLRDSLSLYALSEDGIVTPLLDDITGCVLHPSGTVHIYTDTALYTGTTYAAVKLLYSFTGPFPEAGS